jgi:hypothetical protein
LIDISHWFAPDNFWEIFGISAYDVVTKSMKRVDDDAIRSIADEFGKSCAHILRCSFGKGKREYLLGFGISFSQDVCDTEREDLRLARPWSCNDHDRTVDRIDCPFLLRIERVVRLSKWIHGWIVAQAHFGIKKGTF